MVCTGIFIMQMRFKCTNMSAKFWGSNHECSFIYIYT